MSANELNGKLKQAKGFARELWGEIIGDERAFTAGAHDRIIGKLQVLLDINQDEAEERFDGTVKKS